MRLHRFYVNKPLGEELVVESVGAEKEIVHQWLRVFRFTAGDEVILFSPLHPGFDYTYRIDSTRKDGVTLTFVSKKENILPKRELTLCMAIVKKDTFETVVRQATELGATAIVPILAGRSEKKNLNLKRLKILAKEAGEQCGRGDVPTIKEIESFKDAFTKRASGHNIFASLLGSAVTTHSFSPSEALCVWVGPEGGWTGEEETVAQSGGAKLVRLGDTVLKADTAAVATLTLILGRNA